MAKKKPAPAPPAPPPPPPRPRCYKEGQHPPHGHEMLELSEDDAKTSGLAFDPSHLSAVWRCPGCFECVLGPVINSTPSRERKLVEHLWHAHKSAKRDIEDFMVKLVEDPANAMSWSISRFTSAAKVEVYGRAIDAFTRPDSKATFDSVRDYATREVHLKARNPARSSSPTSNLMDQELMAAWADVLEVMTWIK